MDLMSAFLPNEDELLAEDPFYLGGIGALKAQTYAPRTNTDAILTPLLKGLGGGLLMGIGQGNVEQQIAPQYSQLISSLNGSPYEFKDSGTAKSDLLAALMGQQERQAQQGSFADLQDFVQKELIKSQIINAGNEPKRVADLEKTTYDRITGAPITKQFQDIEANFNTLNALANEDSKPAAVGMISALARIWDPAATVREGEYKINSEAQSMLDQVVGDWRAAITGKSPLMPETRKKMIQAAAQKYNQFGQQYEAERQLLLDALTRQQGNPENVPTRGFKPWEPPPVGVFAGEQKSGGGQDIPAGMMLMRNKRTGETKLVPR